GMFKIAFSTVACPDWSLREVARRAASWEFDGVELRSFGEGSTRFACDPGLTDSGKVRGMFRNAGVEIADIATGVKFDAPIFPPVMGNLLLSQREAGVPEGCHFVDVAKAIGARYVRVFGFDVPRFPPPQTRGATLTRIAARLAKVCDHARHRDCFVMIENGGSFATAEDLAEIIAKVNSPLLMACYDLFAAHTVKDDLEEGIKLLGPRLAMARLRDRSDGKPVALGTGELPCREFVRLLADAKFGGWVTYEWEKAWLPELAEPETVLAGVPRTVFGWANEGRPALASPAA
ncbi:MAG: sugar phosphate isomerase/epimerase family protein, partial [Phycisphaerales bacterium]